MDKHERGMYHKFDVTRTDGTSEPGGKHFGCEYFVLDRTHDPFAPPAILAYADACESEYPVLAADLRKWMAGERPAEFVRMVETVRLADHDPITASDRAAPVDAETVTDEQLIAKWEGYRMGTAGTVVAGDALAARLKMRGIEVEALNRAIDATREEMHRLIDSELAARAEAIALREEIERMKAGKL